MHYPSVLDPAPTVRYDGAVESKTTMVIPVPFHERDTAGPQLLTRSSVSSTLKIEYDAGIRVRIGRLLERRRTRDEPSAVAGVSRESGARQRRRNAAFGLEPAMRRRKQLRIAAPSGGRLARRGHRTAPPPSPSVVAKRPPCAICFGSSAPLCSGILPMKAPSTLPAAHP